MTKGLIDPVETARRAIQRGELTRGNPAGGHWPDFILDAIDGVKRVETIRVKLPEEAGIARLKPTPPAPKVATPHRQRGDLHRQRRARYVLTKSMRPDLFP